VSTSVEQQPPEPGHGAGTSYEQIQASPDFQQLKHALRRFVFPATVVFLGWYLLYVLMTVYARGFMGHKLLGNINVAYVFGLLQFISTFVIAYIYSRYAERHLDPLADKLRDHYESGAR
jgi:uncharacterized membrane protein (DUF485 family)